MLRTGDEPRTVQVPPGVRPRPKVGVVVETPASVFAPLQYESCPFVPEPIEERYDPATCAPMV